MEGKTTKNSKHSHHHFGRLRSRHKRYAAAIAGAAIMAGVALPGIPAAEVFASEAPSGDPAITLSQEELARDKQVKVKKVVAENKIRDKHKDKDSPPGRGWHEHVRSWPGVDENQAWYENGKIYYRSNNDRSHVSFVDYFDSFVNFVKYNSEIYGFDPYLDSYKLLTATSKRAIVEVTRHDTGRLYDIVIERTSGNHWQIVEVRAL